MLTDRLILQALFVSGHHLQRSVCLLILQAVSLVSSYHWYDSDYLHRTVGRVHLYILTEPTHQLRWLMFSQNSSNTIYHKRDNILFTSSINSQCFKSISFTFLSYLLLISSYFFSNSCLLTDFPLIL